jgi:nicotinate-nucleotide pyrophosphorylase (carboxylating)
MHTKRRQLAGDGLSLEAFFALQVKTGLVDRLLELGLDEDTGNFVAKGGFVGDITSEACEAAGGADAARAQFSAFVSARATAAGGVVAGLAVVQRLVQTKFRNVRLELLAKDGDVLTGRTRVARVEGPARDCLLLERTMLNVLGRLSGVASLTRTYVLAAGSGGAHVCDTRKTTPGMRVLEKYAVRCGGGVSHRMGLHDALLIKDNHLAGVSLAQLHAFVQRAVQAARARAEIVFAEVEVDSIEQLREIVKLPRGVVDVVLLDNMNAEELRACCAVRDASAPELLLEASGGVTLATIGAIAQSGVDRVSVGALTHSSVQLDFGLDAKMMG